MDESARVLFLLELFFTFFNFFLTFFTFFLLFFTFFYFFLLFFTFFYFFVLLKKPSKIQTKPNAPLLHIQPAEADTGAQRVCHHGH